MRWPCGRGGDPEFSVGCIAAFLDLDFPQLLREVSGGRRKADQRFVASTLFPLFLCLRPRSTQRAILLKLCNACWSSSRLLRHSAP